MKTHFSIILGMAALAFAPAPIFGDILFPNDDVFVETAADGSVTNTYDGHVVSSQITFGLAASNGNTAGRRRSYMEFTLGSDMVGSATLSIYNYWGANMGGGGNPAANTTLRLRGTGVGAPLQITEPASSLVTDFVPPDNTNFTTTIVSALTVTNVGWYSFDITSWYNVRLGETTTLSLRGATTGGFDFALFEDREGTAFMNGSENTLANSGPRIETTPIPEPTALLLLPVGGLLLLVSRRRR